MSLKLQMQLNSVKNFQEAKFTNLLRSRDNMIKTLKEFYQSINELQIDGYNAPIKLYCDDEPFFINDVYLKNNEIDGTYCNIELKSNRSSLKDDLNDLIRFMDQKLDEEDMESSDKELRMKATEGINLIKKILKK